MFTSESSSEANDIEIIKKRIKKEKVTSQSILLATFLFLWLCFFHFRNVEVDYIDGNVVYIGNESGSPWGNFLITPWKSATFQNALLFNTLFTTDSSYSQINPQIAEKYTVNEEGTKYIITMDSAQYWSDGVRISADDVLFSFEGFLSCETSNSYLSSAFMNILGAKEFAQGNADTISGISIMGNEIEIVLEEPHSTFPLLLTQFVPLPLHILGNLDKSSLTSEIEFFTDLNVVSSGKFMVNRFDDNGNLVLTQNPYYQGENTDIEEFVLYWDYENVELDYYTTTDPSKMISYRSMKGFEEHTVDVLFYRYFLFNMERSDDDLGNVAMQDVRVRQAIYHAIDVERLFNEVYFGKGSLFYGGSLAHAEEIYEYNPEKAILLLEEAEYDFDRTFHISYYSVDSSSRIFLEKVQECLEEIGLTVELTLKTTTQELYDEADYDMTMKNLSAFNTQDWYSEYLSSNPLISQIFGENPEFDALYEELNSVTTATDFDAILIELLELEQELLYKLPMFLIGEGIYINSNRLSVPDDIVFGNTRYFSDIRLEDWYVKQG